MKFEVDEKMIEPIVKDQIASAIVSQMGDTKELVKKMVHLALTSKVDSMGKVGKYSSDNKYDFIEVLAHNAIKNSAKEAIQRIVEGQKPLIEQAIIDELAKAPEQTARAILSAFLEGLQSRYNIKVDFTISNRD